MDYSLYRAKLLVSDLFFNFLNKFYFKASDIGKALGIVNIHSTIQNYEDEDERVIRKAYDPQMNIQNTTFLSSQGVYRLLYTSKKEVAKKFRKWAGNILDDIIFNESAELKRQLEEKEKQHQIELLEKDVQLEKTKIQLQKTTKLVIKKWYDTEPCQMVYGFRNKNSELITIGKTKNIRERELEYMTHSQDGTMFYAKKCFDCGLTERVIHHILDKHRVENNKDESTRFDSFAWFEISEELTIYTIDIVCNFLDGFVGCSEELPRLNIKEKMLECIQHKLNNEVISKTKEVVLPIIIKYNKRDDFNKFVNEYCELGENYECDTYDLTGAYRLWANGIAKEYKLKFREYVQKNYKSYRKYYADSKTERLTYKGIRPKFFILEKEIESKYEEFVLSECELGYNYKCIMGDFTTVFNSWVLKKYPDYIINNKQLDAYVNRHFIKDKMVIPSLKKNLIGIWGVRLNGCDLFKFRTNDKMKKRVVKVDIETNNIIAEYDSMLEASKAINLKGCTFVYYIKNEKIIDNKYIFRYIE